MKKIGLITVMAALCFLLAACGNGQNPPSSGEEDSIPPVQEQTGQPGAAQTGESAADLGDYHVELKDAQLVQDSRGGDALVVTFDWTNNSDSSTISLASVSCTAQQDGEELDIAMIGDDAVCDSTSTLTEAQIGETVSVQYAFSLNDTVAPVTVEIKEVLTGDDAPTLSAEIDPAAL